VSSHGVSVFAPAKLNLFLHVGEERPDGYHALESLVVFADAGDRLQIAPAKEASFRVTGPFAAQVPKGADNLVQRASAFLGEAAAQSEPAAITLEKNLPVAAGLGGGSADAAAVLRGLNALWGLERSESELIEIAAKIGSDVAACLLSRPCWMAGRGESVTPLGLVPPLSLVLVNPGVLLPTKVVFHELNARTGLGALLPPKGAINSLWDLVAYLDDAENDLEAPAARLRPVIDEVLDCLNNEPGCVLAQMSGSGATCFGLFDGHQYAAGAAERIAQDHSVWWVRSCRIAAPDIGVPQRISA